MSYLLKLIVIQITIILFTNLYTYEIVANEYEPSDVYSTIYLGEGIEVTNKEYQAIDECIGIALTDNGYLFVAFEPSDTYINVYDPEGKYLRTLLFFTPGVTGIDSSSDYLVIFTTRSNTILYYDEEGILVNETGFEKSKYTQQAFIFELRERKRVENSEFVFLVSEDNGRVEVLRISSTGKELVMYSSDQRICNAISIMSSVLIFIITVLMIIKLGVIPITRFINDSGGHHDDDA